MKKEGFTFSNRLKIFLFILVAMILSLSFIFSGYLFTKINLFNKSPEATKVITQKPQPPKIISVIMYEEVSPTASPSSAASNLKTTN